MSRAHNSLPAKSNSLRIPFPVMMKTSVPSVTGEGDAMFCLPILKLPPATCFFHNTAPRTRSTHHSAMSSLSATLRKTRSPQMIGVAPLHAGRGSFQAMFSSRLHRTGKSFSLLMPLREGPRHWGQFSPVQTLPARTARHTIPTIRCKAFLPLNQKDTFVSIGKTSFCFLRDLVASAVILGFTCGLIEDNVHAVQVVLQDSDLLEDLVPVGHFGGFFDGFPDRADRIEAIASSRPLQVVPDEPDSGIILLVKKAGQRL